MKADTPVDSEDGKVGVGNQEGEIKWSTIWGILIGDCFHNFVGTVCQLFRQFRCRSSAL